MISPFALIQISSFTSYNVPTDAEKLWKHSSTVISQIVQFMTLIQKVNLNKKEKIKNYSCIHVCQKKEEDNIKDR